MTLAIHLLGRPRFEDTTAAGYEFRSRKSWALLAYLLLSGRPPARAQLASLLFADADDPLRALRWSLAEIRRALRGAGTVEGDPVTLTLGDGTVVDVIEVMTAPWHDVVKLPGLGTDLLDGMVIQRAPAFEVWLLAEQRRVAAAAEAVLHEAALSTQAQGRTDEAIALAGRACAMSPLDENHQALLIGLHRLHGDEASAEAQLRSCTELFDRELGTAPGPAVQMAMRGPSPPGGPADAAAIAAVVEAGSAALAAGAVDAGLASLETAVRLADTTDAHDLRVTARLVMAEALIHSLRGLDEAGLSVLYEVDEIALAVDDRPAVAAARAEIGYVDFLRGRYDRAERWLTDALCFADGGAATVARIESYLGSVHSDRGSYATAIEHLERAVSLARVGQDPRREAYSLAMLGRIALLRGDLDAAEGQLDAAISIAQADHWLALLPLPQTLRGEVQLARGDVIGADQMLRQAFARACQQGDPCWEGMSARGLALVADAMGEPERAREVLADASSRCNRFADPYVWLDVHILDARCALGVRQRWPETDELAARMLTIATRAGMRELSVRAHLHRAALGHVGSAWTAALVAGDVDNPGLQALLS